MEDFCQVCTKLEYLSSQENHVNSQTHKKNLESNTAYQKILLYGSQFAAISETPSSKSFNYKKENIALETIESQENLISNPSTKRARKVIQFFDEATKKTTNSQKSFISTLRNFFSSGKNKIIEKFLFPK